MGTDDSPQKKVSDRGDATIDRSDFLLDPSEAFRRASDQGRVLITRSGTPHLVLSVPKTALEPEAD